MVESQKISGRQLFWVIYTISYGGGIYNNVLAFGKSGRDGLFFPIVSGAVAVLLGVMVWYCSKSFPGLSIFQIIEKLAGGIIGKIFALSYILISIAIVVLILRFFASLVNVFILVNTPQWFIILLVLALSLYIAAKGLEVQARLYMMLMVITLLMFFPGLGIGSIDQFDLNNLLPLFDSTPAQFISGAYLFFPQLCEPILVLFLFTAALRKPSRGLRPITTGLTVGACITPMATNILMVGILGVEQFSRVGYQKVNVMLSVALGEFIQGVEVVMLLVYQLFAISKVAVHSYCALMTASHLLKDRFRWVILAVIGVVVFVVTVSIDSFNEAFFFYTIFSQYVVFPFMALTATLAWVLVLAKRSHNG